MKFPKINPILVLKCNSKDKKEEVKGLEKRVFVLTQALF